MTFKCLIFQKVFFLQKQNKIIIIVQVNYNFVIWDIKEKYFLNVYLQICDLSNILKGHLVDILICDSSSSYYY